MKRKVAAALCLALVLSFGLVAAHGDPGAPEMVLEGGKKGDVDFPHKQHQESLDNCRACHDLFPKEKGAVSRLIQEKALKAKAVMNQCRDCHKKWKKEKKPAGPTSCKACHNVKTPKQKEKPNG